MMKNTHKILFTRTKTTTYSHLQQTYILKAVFQGTTDMPLKNLSRPTTYYAGDLFLFITPVLLKVRNIFTPSTCNLDHIL